MAVTNEALAAQTIETSTTAAPNTNQIDVANANGENVEAGVATTATMAVEPQSNAMTVHNLDDQLESSGKNILYRLGLAEQATFDALTMVPSQRTLAQILSGFPLHETEDISQFEDKVYMPVRTFPR
jgi:hypothetical protein